MSHVVSVHASALSSATELSIYTSYVFEFVPKTRCAMVVAVVYYG